MTKTERKNENQDKRRNVKPSFLTRFTTVTEKQQRLVLIFILAILLTLIIVPRGGVMLGNYEAGDIASRDIKAPRDALIEDARLTEEKRKEAQGAVLPVYDFDTGAGEATGNRLFDVLFEIKALNNAQQSVSVEEFRQRLTSEVGGSLTDQQIEQLRQVPIGQIDLPVLAQRVKTALSPPIVGNLPLFKSESAMGFRLRDLDTQKEQAYQKAEQVLSLDQAYERVFATLQGLDLKPVDIEVLKTLVRPLVRPNLTFNRKETEKRRQEAFNKTAPVLFQVKKGEMIVREGDRVTEGQVSKLSALTDLVKDSRTRLYGFGLFLATLCLFFVGHTFARVNVRKFKPDNRDLLFLASTYLGLFVLIKVCIFISTGLGTTLPAIESTTFYYVIPFAMGSMLVRLVLNSEIALIFAIIGALLVGALFGNDLALAMYMLTGSLTGANGVRHCKERSTLYRAGMQVAVVNVLMVVAIHFISGQNFDLQLLYKAGFAVLGGFLSSVFVTGIIPLIESLFKYTTDIKLLEMANLNSPVLRELMIQAPGTYHHSVVVGNLVESAAEAINANPLLSRVAAYYHDIGKIRKPLYFIENCDVAVSKHTKLAPSMSALILTAHVKDGLEMARENKLGKELIDIIQQHHGTTLIKFFYEKAQNVSDPGMQQIKESDYRYPGPKPQTREAALIMLADAIEAASRTLTDPTPARIQGMVQKIINNIFIDGQLDECELTLKDLHVIAKSFNRILSGIFHHRVDYPEPAFKEKEKDPGKKKEVEGSRKNTTGNGKVKTGEPAKESDSVKKRKKDENDPHNQPTDEPKDRDPKAKAGSTEDLKRLGMS